MTADEKVLCDEFDDEVRDLFSSFDDVRASDDLKEATLARILGTSKSDERVDCASVDEPETETGSARIPEAPANVTASAGGNAAAPTRRAKLRAIRIAALAACLAFALAGGTAYALPVSYYEVEQGNAKVTLGVNCFGIAVSATSDDQAGQDVINATDLRNIPYEQAIDNAVRTMEQHDPAEAIEYGPQNGERQRVEPQEGQGGPAPERPSAEGASGQPAGPEQPPESRPSQEPVPDAPAEGASPEGPGAQGQAATSGNAANSAPADAGKRSAPQNPQGHLAGNTAP